MMTILSLNKLYDVSMCRTYQEDDGMLAEEKRLDENRNAVERDETDEEDVSSSCVVRQTLASRSLCHYYFDL